MDDSINLGVGMKLIRQCSGAEGIRGSGACIFSKVQFKNVSFNNIYHRIGVCILVIRFWLCCTVIKIIPSWDCGGSVPFDKRRLAARSTINQ